MDLVPDDMLERAAHRFKALSEPARLGLLNALQRGGEQHVQALVETTGQRQASVSKHLGLLAQDGLVVRRRDGLRVYYRIADPTLPALCALLVNQLRLQDIG